MRPGRLDRILYVAPPDRAARLEIFDVNFRRMAMHEAVDRQQLADMVRTFRRRPFRMDLSELSGHSPGSALPYRPKAVPERRLCRYARTRPSTL